MRSFIICIPHPLFAGDNIEKNEMGGASSEYGRGERRVEDLGGET
jgi:hypothetical protein